MNRFIPQMEPWFGVEETNALTDYMEGGGWVTEFKQTEEFERLIAEYTGSKFCHVVNNGTISLTLAALACGIEAGDEVIVPNYTMVATPNSIKLFGAVPIFIDVEPNTLCLDFELVEKAINSKTKAIMLVNANGRYPSYQINQLEKLCSEHNIILIEDSAQALGSFYPDGRHMGTVGSVGSFSFSAPKVISTGQGGALITNDEKISKKISQLKDFGRSGGGNDIHEVMGYNFKFTDIQAVVGIEQMKKLQFRVDRKKQILKLYKDKLGSVDEVKFFKQDLTKTTPWFIDSMVKERDSLMGYLKNNNIGTRVMYPPINKQLAYNEKGNHEISNLIGQKGLWLPSASQLSEKEIGYICNKIKYYYSRRNQ
jgi:perosamine synthetase